MNSSRMAEDPVLFESKFNIQMTSIAVIYGQNGFAKPLRLGPLQSPFQFECRDLGQWGGKTLVRWIAVIWAPLGWQNSCEVDRRDLGQSGVAKLL